MSNGIERMAELLIDEIDKFLAQTGMLETRFGLYAMDDPTFVSTLRTKPGIAPVKLLKRDIRKVRKYMDDHAAGRLLGEIDAFLKRTGIPPTTFGWNVAKDPVLVSRLRGNRHGKPAKPNKKTVRKVREFIKNHEADELLKELY